MLQQMLELQALPHFPQFFASDGTQSPLQHSSPGWHACPQLPQLAGSFSTSWQPVAQQLDGATQPAAPLQRQLVPTQLLPCVQGGLHVVAWQLPPIQDSPGAHFFSQLPQWLGSDSLS
jgi:hypothetical protein